TVFLSPLNKTDVVLDKMGQTAIPKRTIVADRLGLAAPDLPWHTERGRIGRLAGALGVTAGALGKPARDVTLLAQNEVGEVEEGAPGGSSAMAHKHNPVAAVSTLAATAQAPGLVATLLACAVQEHQRGAGSWQAEWQPLRSLLVAVGSGAAWLRTCVEGLVVHTDVMRANLERAGAPSGSAATDPVGSAGHFVDRALANHSALRSDDSAARRTDG
ncbi:lyase family protein, partial [Asanoa sp. NPDC050611]|uniref:lyase family protein n=1 Tax=Asanoa sp. NPDC050611 TaxID=3157098 RepID=UPI0033E24CD9